MKPNQVNARTVLVTPTKAAAWLANNAGNRPLSPARVERYAAQMREGHWELNGETIILGPGDELIDGQHRLSALVAADVKLQMLVARGVAMAARPTVDTGRTRSLSHIVAMMDADESNVSKIVSWAKLKERLLGRRAADMTHEEWAAWRKDNGPGIDWVREHYLGGAKGPMRSAPVAGSLVFAYRTKPMKLREFATQLRDGTGLKAGDPAHTMRKWFVDQPVAMRSDALGVARRVLAAAAAHVSGERLDRSQIGDRGLVFFAKAHGVDLGREHPADRAGARLADEAGDE